MKKAFTYFWQHSIIAALCVSIMVAPACSLQQTQNIVSDIQRFLPAVTNVATAACAFVQNPLCATGVAAVTSSANIAVTELQKYLEAVANGTATPTMWDFLNQAMTQFETDASNIFNLVGSVPPNVQAEIIALVGAAQALLAIIETLVPTNPAASSKMTAKFSASLPAGEFSLSQWVSSYNAKVASCQKVLPANAKLKKVHIHSAVLRYATVGILK